MDSYEEVIDALFKRGVNSPYELVPPQGDLTPVKLAIQEYDRRKAKKKDIHAGLLVWLIRNPPQAKNITPKSIFDFKTKIKSRCLTIEGNIRWAIEETYSREAMKLG